MASDGLYSTGTVSITNNTKIVTGVGTAFVSAGLGKGAKFLKGIGTGVVDTVDSETQLTLVDNWTGGTLSGVTYNIEYQSDLAALVKASQAIVALNSLLGTSGNLAALGGLTSAADKLPYFNGAGTMAMQDFGANARDLLSRWTRATTTSQAKLVLPEDTDNGSNYATLQPPSALGGNRVWTGPDADMTISTYMAGLMATGNVSALRAAIGAVNIAGDTMTGGLTATKFVSLAVGISDDAVYSTPIPFAGAAGLLIVSGGGIPSSSGLPNGIYWIRKSATAPVKIVAYNDTGISLGTRDLTGTTGTDGGVEMNVVSSTTLKFENRSGSAQSINFTFVGN